MDQQPATPTPPERTYKGGWRTDVPLCAYCGEELEEVDDRIEIDGKRYHSACVEVMQAEDK